MSFLIKINYNPEGKKQQLFKLQREKVNPNIKILQGGASKISFSLPKISLPEENEIEILKLANTNGDKERLINKIKNEIKKYIGPFGVITASEDSIILSGSYNTILRFGQSDNAVLRLFSAPEGTSEEAFLAEMNGYRIQFKLSGTGLVSRILAYGTYGSNKKPWGLLEKADGDLFDLVASESSPLNEVPLIKRLKYVIDIAECLVLLRQKKILHLDIKLENFLVKDDKIILTDFGNAIQMDNDNSFITSPRIIGTARYLDIDGATRVNGRYKYGYSSDMWSAGVVIFNLIFPGVWDQNEAILGGRVVSLKGLFEGSSAFIKVASEEDKQILEKCQKILLYGTGNVFDSDAEKRMTPDKLLLEIRQLKDSISDNTPVVPPPKKRSTSSKREIE